MRRKHLDFFFLVPVFTALSAFLFSGYNPAHGEGALARARWHNNQGVVYMDQHNYIRAAAEFSRSIEAAPDYAIGHANLGIAHFSLGQYDSAMVALQTALEHNPSLLQAHYTMGLIYHARGIDHEKGLVALQLMAEAAPEDPHVLYYLSQFKGRLGYGEEAIALLQKVIGMDPYNISAYFALANQYRRLDRLEQWRETLQTFNRFSQAGYTGIGSSYQGQGIYAEAIIDVRPAERIVAGAGVDPFFTDAGRTEEPPGNIRFAGAADWKNDGRTGLLVLADGLSCYSYDDQASSMSVGARPALPPGFVPAHLIAADFDNSGMADLLFSGEQLVRLVAEAPGEWDEAHFFGPPARSVYTADIDHDGDLDLLVSTDQGSLLWANDGQGGFADITGQAGLTAAHTARRVVFSDFDNNRAIDIFILGEDRLQIFSNNRDGTFSEVAASLGLGNEGRWVDIAIEDFDQDGYMDVCLLEADGVFTFYKNQHGNRFTARQTIHISLDQVRGLMPFDLDNNGALDLAVFGDGGIRLLRYRGEGFHLEDTILFEGEDIRHALTLDFDADGQTDLWADGRMLRNQTAGGRWLTIVPRGQGSNRDAIGAKIEVKTPDRLQKREVRNRSPLVFGLAGADTVEFVRVLWPSGVRQAELASPANERLPITEVDRKGTSCPIVYAWDGEKWRFVTDINGGAIVGYLTGPGEYNTPDPDEYIRLGPIAPKNGYYAIKVANHLEEVIFVDALELLAVDHLPGVEVFPNERLPAAPPFPDFDLYALRDLKPLQAARDHHGRDILPQLTHIDDDWYDGFALTDIHGYAETFSIVLDLGDLRDNPHPVLLAYGWVDYAHSTSNWAAAQRGWRLLPLSVEVPGEDGSWQLARADMGTPAGLPKHMVFDLTGIFPADDFRLRITTNRAVYWDQFLVGTRVETPRKIHRRSPDRAELSWRGYPEHTAIKGTFAFRYHYDRLHREAPWSTHRGAFTRYGPVEELVGTADSRFVIMGHGDEITAHFSADALPVLEPGLVRTFLLYSVGFGKDMDFHSAHSLTVEPLPFHGMSAYPYPATESYPQTPEHIEYLLESNTRHLKGYY